MNSVLNNLPGSLAVGADGRRREASGVKGQQQRADGSPRRRSSRDLPLPEATISELDGVRYLHLGHTPWVQGAMRIRRPRKLELEYVQRLMVWLLLHDPEQWTQLRCVHLGLGAGAGVRFTHAEVQARHSTVVEINPQVIAACRQWFRLPADEERLAVLQADAGAWVAEPARRGMADVLCVDLYDHDAAAPVLGRCRLLPPLPRPVGRWRGHDGQPVRPQHQLPPQRPAHRRSLWRRGPCRHGRRAGSEGVDARARPMRGNTIVIAQKSSVMPEREILLQRAAAVTERFGLRAARWVHALQPLQPPTSA
jgi:spermidine synthase